MSTAIVEVQTAVAEFDRVAAGIAFLKEQYSGVVYDVQTTKGMDEAKAARAAVREPRYEIEKVRKAAKAPMLALGKELDSRAKEITEEILAIESPIDEQIKNEETRKEREKQAKIDAETKRVADIQARIEAIREFPDGLSLRSAAEVQKKLEEAEAFAVDDSFEEFADTARSVLSNTVLAVKGIHYERVQHEAEQERIKAERAELEKLRAEQALRDAAERARLADEERKAKAERDAEAARHAAHMKAQQEEQNRINAARQAELDRIEREKQAEWERREAEQRAAREAEETRLANERAEFERQQEEFRKAQEPEAIVRTTERPTDDQMLATLCATYSADRETVIEWILSMDFSRLSIAA